jgi:hypothetical protein
MCNNNTNTVSSIDRILYDSNLYNSNYKIWSIFC